jgi:NAD(P)-dependent dehydrogenase (short-subunit alcohol dehydrogenase family)
MLTEVTAAALAQYQIRANCIVLGPVLPSTGQSEESWRKTEARLPLKRSGDPDDAARAAIFLATNDYLTGSVVRVDGGEWLGDASSE